MAGPGVGAFKTINAAGDRVDWRYRLGQVEAAKDSWHYKRLRWGTIAIQEELIALGYLTRPRAPLNGFFGVETSRSVQRFQRDALADDDGIVGPITSRRLFHSLFVWWEAFYAIPNRLAYGTARLESNMDPAAEGERNRSDLGIVQWNLEAHLDITAHMAIAEARSYAVPRAVAALAAAYARFGSWPIACASHNSPERAKEWFRDGEPPTEQIAEYVELVYRYAAMPL